MPKVVSSTDFRLFPGDGVLSWDGIAFVNGGLESTAVVISQKDFTGQILDIQVLEPLAAGSKRLYLPESDFNLQENTYFDIHADQPLYLIALRGDRSSNLLWENQVLVLPGATPVPETGSEQGN